MPSARSRPALVVTTGFDEYQQELLRGVLPVLAPHGPVLVINSFNFTEEGLSFPVEQLIRRVAPYGVLATTCVSPQEERDLVAVLTDLGVPTVRIGVRVPGMTCVRGDDLAGMRAVMRHLLDERGVRRPAHARGVAHQPDAVRREQVFREELTARGIPVDEELIFDGFFWHETTYRELRSLLQRRRDLDAVVAANDLSALGALKALTDEGLRVPEDVLVTGFDNDTSALSWPTLTTVDPALREQGAAAARQLLQEVAGGSAVDEVLVPSTVVVRGSTRAWAPGDPGQFAAAVHIAGVAQEQLAARDALWALNFDLSACTSVPEVATTLAGSHLSRLGVHRCFIGIYTRDPLTRPVPAGEPGGTGEPLRARVVLDYRNGHQEPVADEVFPLGQLLPSALREELATGLLLFQPLSSSESPLGYLLLEMGQGANVASDWLRLSLSRTLETLFSTQAIKNHATNLERTVARRTFELASRSEQLQAEVEVRRRTEERLQQAVADLHRIAMSDGLTQLANRVALREHLTAQWEALARAGDELAVLMIDVDLFKAYNDHYGHVQGDEALRTVASCLARAARCPQDLAGRYGGEEFVLILPGSSLEAARLVAERFRASLAEAAIPHERSSVAPVMTASVGIAVARAEHGLDAWQVVERADQVLYQAKTQGRDQVRGVRLGPGLSMPGVPQARAASPGSVPSPR